MTEIDRASLDRILPPVSGSADWDDVIGRSGMKQRRRRLIVVLAAVALVAVATASAFGMRALYLDKGFIGLPPEGATPSSPESGELEISYWARWAANGTDGRTRAWVYADGRLISTGGRPDVPESPLSAGFLEQRLTPEGVELLRSEIAAAGDFGDLDQLAPPGKPPCPLGQSPSDREKAIANGDCQLPTPEPAPDAPITVPWHTPISVVGLGTLVHVDHARDLTRLYERLTNPGSWLPESAWVDRNARAYVASKYAVCYGGWPPDEPMERSKVLALFPEAVRGLLSGATLREGPLFGSPGHFRPSSEYCFDGTTEEARQIVAAFGAAGLERHSAARLNYRLEGKGDEEAGIYFEPYLPHGEFTCSVCG